jgi:cytochrome c oxidase subunit I+III
VSEERGKGERPTDEPAGEERVGQERVAEDRVGDEVRRGQEARLLRVWSGPPGWRKWSDVNNSAVGVWYVATTFVFFLFGGTLAVLMRAQLAAPDNTLVAGHTYDQLFTMHGSIMMFLFAVPAFEAISILLLPQVLGARDLPFPRLSAFGFWAFLLGGTFFCGTLLFGIAPRGGWFMYPPLTSAYQPGWGADIWLLGLSFIEVSAIAAAVELVVGVLKCRPPGMRIHLVPLYAWYILVVAVMLLFAFPPLIAGTALLELERAFGWPFFDPAKGGDPLLWQHLFWLFGHPEVYIVFLPSVALVATLLPAFTRVPVAGYVWVVLSAVGTGFLSFGLWVHHMFTTGLPSVSLALFSAASQAVAIPTGIQIACFVATMLVGKVTVRVPMLFTLAGLAVFVQGGFTGVMVAMVPFDLQAHDTHFIVAHLHSVLLGGTVFPILAGVWYWYPFVTGKMLSERMGAVSAGLVTAGFAVTFLPMHVTGLLGMPRRVYSYPAELGIAGVNLVSSLGALVLALGVLVAVIEVARPKRRQPDAPRNPWGAPTLEWLAEMPPDKPWGVRSIPAIESRWPLWDQPDLMERVDRGELYLPDAEEGFRETLVTSPVDARPVQVLRVAEPSFLPMLAAFSVGGFFILSTFHVYALAIASLVLAVVLIVAWLWTGTARIPEKETKDVGLGLSLPIYVSGSGSVGWWGLLVTLLADLTAFLSLVFGYLFYWTIHADFPPEALPDPDPLWLGGGLAALLGSWALTALGIRWNRRDRAAAYHLGMLTAVALAVVGGGATLLAPHRVGLMPDGHVYGAIVWILAIWIALHAALGVLFLLYCLARRAAGRMTARHDMEQHNALLLWHFVAGMAALAALVLAGFPLVT